MEIFQLLTLAIVQGLTEFLPISSSAHLILVPRLFGWPDQGLAFDVAVHIGSLLAVVVYFRRDIAALLLDWLASCRVRHEVGQSRLAWGVLIGTIPAAGAGLLLNDWIETALRSPLVIAATTIGFGLLLWLADTRGQRNRNENSLSWRDILLIGAAQALALVPGTSRSGITMTAALALGLTREAAARFSFLLAIPLISLAGAYKTLQLVQQSEVAIDWVTLSWGIALSATAAWLCIHLFLSWIARSSMLPFVIYRLLLGGVLLYIFL